MLLIPACQGRDAHLVAVVIQLETNCQKNLAYFTTACSNLGFQSLPGLSSAPQAIWELGFEALAFHRWRHHKCFTQLWLLGLLTCSMKKTPPKIPQAQPEMLIKVLQCLTQNSSVTLSSLYQKVHSSPRPEAKLSCGRYLPANWKGIWILLAM